MANFDWKGFETAVAKSALASLRKVIESRKGCFYAAAFHEFYAEYNELISLPLLALNTEEALRGDEEGRWSSADWSWTQLPYAGSLKTWGSDLNKESLSEDENHWEKSYDRFIQTFINIAKLLRRELRGHPQTHKDFGVFVFTEDDEIEVLQKCTTKAEFKKLFPALYAIANKEEKLGRSSLDEKLATYRKDLRQYEKEIRRLKEEAIPMLLNALNDKEQCWKAADILGNMGIKHPEVISGLRKKAKPGEPQNFHYTCALALLGDTEFLLALAAKEATRAIGVRGLLQPLGTVIFLDHKILLDYRPIEELLKKAENRKEVRSHADYLGSREISLTDLEEALRGLESKYPFIRRHAVMVLGDRRLGKKAAERILPAVAMRCQDSDSDVRYSAIGTLTRWKSLAKPYIASVRKLLKDPEEDVAERARRFLEEIANP